MSANHHPLRIYTPSATMPAPAQHRADVIAHSPLMCETLNKAERFAQSDATVLLLGESGTGKEVVARHIHEHSDRQGRPYVRLNCAAIPDTLVESELFGHARGAFTGADTQRPGHLEYADDGTILLDEVGELPLQAQAKLLRVLEEGEFQRVGCVEPTPMRARVIAATNRDLTGEVAAGRFRPDLYYRLFVLNLHVPPLRERTEDIRPLAEHFGRMFNADDTVNFSQRALQQLHCHSWPGNVRELKNAIQRAVVLANSPRIEHVELLATPTPPTGSSSTVANGALASMDNAAWPDVSFAEAEQRTLQAALERCEGNQAAAARKLGVTPRTVSNMLRRQRAA